VGDESCWCSGTLSAAIYAAKCGVPAVAISQDVRGQLREKYRVDAAVEALASHGWPQRSGRYCRVLNINLPSCVPVKLPVVAFFSRRGGYGGDWKRNAVIGDFFDWRQVWVRDCDPNSDVTHLNKGRVTISEKSVCVAFSQAKKP
jgi:broad specificity polyphosphatase/5'/3'-nucleotidase SurE